MSTAKAACTRKSSRVAIVGGGLAGMVAADALASRGFEDLHVFDMGETFVFWFNQKWRINKKKKTGKSWSGYPIIMYGILHMYCIH